MSSQETEQKKLSAQEAAFVESFLVHLQKAKAAEDAGYSKKTCKQIGYEIYNRPHVKAAIDKALQERTISAAETTKLISDTAQASLTDYLVKKIVTRTPQIKKPLSQLIDDYQLHIIKEEEYCAAKGFTEEEFDKFQEGLNYYRDQILKFEIELKYNPLAYRIVDGEPDLVETMDLDLVALAADKERGKVKSIKHTMYGIQVEMYSASEAQEKLAKMHGLYEKDNKQKAVDLSNAKIIFK